MLNMHGGYLAIESSRDTNVVWAHLTTAELLYRNAPDTAGWSVLSKVVDGGWIKWVSKHGRGVFSLTCQPSERKKESELG